MNATVDVTNIRIETPRLILRPWRESDLADLYDYASIPGVGEMAGWCHHESEETSRMILSSFIQNKKTLALEWKENGKVIGSLGLEEMRPDPVKGERHGREFGYVLAKDYWGKGLMPEAVKGMIEYAFTVLNWDYITCGHFLRNDRSRRVIEKCGFQYFGDSDFETHMGTVEKCRNYIIYNSNK